MVQLYARPRYLTLFIVVVDFEVEANACINYGLSACCSVFDKIKIRMCKNRIGETYYVYKLPKPPGCYAGYCVDRVAGSCEPNFKRDANDNCICKYT